MNQISKSNKSRKTSKPKTPEERFRHALEKLQRFSQKNQKLEADLNTLKERVNNKIQYAEEACVVANLNLAIKLASMFDRKTLAEYHRQELFGWIMEIRGEIVASPFNEIVQLELLDLAMEAALDALQKYGEEKLRKKLKKQGLSGEHIDDVIAQHKAQEPTEEEIADFFEEILSEAANEEAADDDTFVQDDLFGFHVNDEKTDNTDDVKSKFNEFFGFDEVDDAYFDEDLQIEKEIEGLLNGKAVKTLFRRIAKVLHPDLVTNPEEKEKRHHKMAALLKARDEKDLPAILQLYTETVGEIPSDIFSGNIENVTKIIENQIDEQRDTHFLLLKKSPELLFYYENFYSPTKNKEHLKIERYKKYLAKKAIALEGLKCEMRTLSILKACLDERYSLHAADGFDVF